MERNVQRQDWMSDEVFDWAQREEKARLNSLERLNAGGWKTLIAIKAQHPLNPDGTPGPEYTQRLEEALRVAHDCEMRGLGVEFMVFGGIHEGCKTTTLATAGGNWLIAHGVDKFSITAQPTVFSGNDEDRMTAEYFNSDVDFSELHVILSAGQWERSRLYFYTMGWQPFLHPIVFLDAKPNHSTVCELWGAWAVPAFAKGPAAIEAATEEIRQKHKAEASK